MEQLELSSVYWFVFNTFFFSRTRDDLRAAHLRINQMLADYGDVVPRREFEMLETSYRVRGRRERESKERERK